MTSTWELCTAVPYKEGAEALGLWRKTQEMRFLNGMKHGTEMGRWEKDRKKMDRFFQTNFEHISHWFTWCLWVWNVQTASGCLRIQDLLNGRPVYRKMQMLDVVKNVGFHVEKCGKIWKHVETCRFSHGYIPHTSKNSHANGDFQHRWWSWRICDLGWSSVTFKAEQQQCSIERLL